MKYIMDLIKGIFIGIANIIPGVSGGTMAVSLGIYDRLISSITGLLKNVKKSLQTLIPILLGAAIGIVGFTYAIEFLLSKYTLPTCLTFVGLILGGIPILVKHFKAGLDEKQGGKISAANVIAFVLLFALVIFMAFQQGADNELTTFDVNAGNMIKLFFAGLIASATMVVPGISGSLVLMILGYYYGVLNTIKNFLDALKVMDMAGLGHGFMLLLPFGIGVILGIFLIAKAIEYLFKKHTSNTYSAILGLIIASPVAIFSNTNALADLSSDTAVIRVIAGIVLLIGGAAITYFLGKKEA